MVLRMLAFMFFAVLFAVSFVVSVWIQLDDCVTTVGVAFGVELPVVVAAVVVAWALMLPPSGLFGVFFERIGLRASPEAAPILSEAPGLDPLDC